MHARYRLTTVERLHGKRVTLGLAEVEAKSVVHARQLGIDLGAEHHTLRIERLEPDPLRPLERRFADCPHCQFLKENGF
jgi:hypothetical protein